MKRSLSGCLWAALFFVVLWSVGASAAAEVPSVPVHAPLQALNDSWGRTLDAVGQKDTALIARSVEELAHARDLAGFQTLDDMSLFLLNEGFESARNNDREQGAFFLRQALALSPTSPRVLLGALKLKLDTGGGFIAGDFFYAIRQIFNSPLFVLKLISILILPCLWALTLGLYAAFIMYFSVHAHELIAIVAKKLPPTSRGFLSPSVVLVILILPVLFGPLWCLICWSAISFPLAKGKHTLGMAAGIILSVWGLGLSVHYGIETWLAEPGARAALRVFGGTYAAGDREALEALAAREPRAGAVYYALGQIERKNGDFERARKSFRDAESLVSESGAIHAELGLVSFLEGDVKNAEKEFEEAELSKFSSAAFLFDYSKIKFDLYDTEASKNFFQRAHKKDADLADGFRTKEDRYGIKSEASIAPIRLPFTALGRELAAPVIDDTPLAAPIAPPMRGFGGAPLKFFGLAFFAFFAGYSKKKEVAKRLPFYRLYAPPKLQRVVLLLLPGGALMLARKYCKAFFVASFVALLALPLLQWPRSLKVELELPPALFQWYVCIAAILVLLILSAGYYIFEDLEERER